MADTVALPPFAPLLASLTQIDPGRSTPMLDMLESNSNDTTDGTTALMLGVAPAQAVATGYQGLAHSLSLLMLGDTSAHNAFAATSAAIVTATVSRLLGAGVSHG